MIDRLRPHIASAYLLLCLLLGGSPQGVWRSAILQLIAVGLIAWSWIAQGHERSARAVRQLWVIVGIAVLLIVAQLFPLSVGIWSTFPGRSAVLAGFDLLGFEPGPMPISLAPYDSIETALALLPPVAMLSVMLRLRTYSPVSLAAALIVGAGLGVLLGIVQVSSPVPEQSPWYLYPIVNYGVATGFFANSNHMASLLLVSIPFIAALGATLRERGKDVRMQTMGLVLAFSGLILVALGLLLNRSLAGLGLGVPVLIASLIILFGLPRRFGRSGVAVIGLGGIAALALLWTAPVGSGFDQLGASTSVTSRQQILTKSAQLVREFGPVGTGLGTFKDIYPLLEDPAEVDRYYVNHAHNDYVELVVETGLPGAILILLFLAWWASAVGRMFRSAASDQFAYAGAIASTALLIHSAVDYPLRTAALGAVFAMSLALILQSRRTAGSDKDLRPTRHLVVD